MKRTKKVWYGWAGFRNNSMINKSKLGVKYFIYETKRDAELIYNINTDVRKVKISEVRNEKEKRNER